MEQMEENTIRLVTAKNQGAFDMDIWNKWRLCLKAHSCCSFVIFFISSSVRTLSCWDNWEGFYISASSRITDVGCVNKGKRFCTSYLMLSSLDIKEYYGKPFNTAVLFLTTLPNPPQPPSLFPFEGMSHVTELLIHFKKTFSLFYLRDSIVQSYCQFGEVQGGKAKGLGTYVLKSFSCNIKKENARVVYGSAGQSIHLQMSCPRSCSFLRLIKLREVPHRSYNFYCAIFLPYQVYLDYLFRCSASMCRFFLLSN